MATKWMSIFTFSSEICEYQSHVGQIYPFQQHNFTDKCPPFKISIYHRPPLSIPKMTCAFSVADLNGISRGPLATHQSPSFSNKKIDTVVSAFTFKG